MFRFNLLENLDFVEFSLQLTFGELFETRQCFNVTVLEDSEFEEDENFIIEVITADGQTIIGDNTTTINIQDNDGVSLSYTAL